MDIVDRCQIAWGDMNLVHRISGALSNLQAGAAYLDNHANLPPRLDREYEQMAKKLGRLDAVAQELLSGSERWLKRVEKEVGRATA